MPYQNLTPRQNHILEEFNGHLYPDRMDVQSGRLWDSLTFLRYSTINHTNAQFFTYTDGKTYRDTNLNQSRKLNPPEAFSIHRIVFSFSKDTPDEEVYTLAEDGVWTLWIGLKMYLRGLFIHMETHNCSAPFHTCTFCQSIFANASICPNCGASSFTISGDPDIDPTGRQFYMDVSPRILLVSQQLFYVSFDCTPAHTCTADVKFWCHFEGLHARGVA